MIDGNQIKKDFPIYRHQPNLVYLDTTATSLKPQQVIDKENEYYTKYSANIFRGIYKISEKATEEYERVREKIAHFIGAKSAGEIVFVRNATEAINLVAAGVGKTLKTGDEIVTTIMEHHSNFVPWQQRALKKHIAYHVSRITSEGKLDEKDLLGKINNKTRMVAFTHVSNVLGTINPVKTLIKKIKAKNPHCLILVDGAQAAAHFKIDVRDLGCDFYVFSSHKMLGPTGVGVLWGRYELLDNMNPYQYGGEMISAVYVDRTEFKDPPHKFEAGTPHIAGVIGLGAAIDYLRVLGMDKVRQHEIEMTSYALKLLRSLKGLKIYGPQNPENRGGVIAFTIERIHAHDIAQILDSNNICIRAGHHCAMPLHLSLDVASTARASFYVYTTKEDCPEKETKEKTNP
ncbi:MAG: Cysteine desulfurase [Candidatus Gottesmanbacteria bacterium GW2011_GWB1_43_11]|uniref:Cysteine desulfurase n=1 Tax=Candidatus Gottesmanbacteria bacterium GW2011_GWB1_43_11 TaxID=1618446 RepID=A0A0G1EWB2_9BACT|nr:MAG: Cysteine desulfurase [Candidatus Gottesmanbacteria bacterium GW2011_GWB1_43_11]